MTRFISSSKAVAVVLCCLLGSPLTPARPAPAAEPDCDSRFIAFIGADAYQFSPAQEGELGSVRLFSVLSYPEAAARGELGRALWRVRVFPAKGDEAVFTGRGTADRSEE